MVYKKYSHYNEKKKPRTSPDHLTANFNGVIANRQCCELRHHVSSAPCSDFLSADCTTFVATCITGTVILHVLPGKEVMFWPRFMYNSILPQSVLCYQGLFLSRFIKNLTCLEFLCFLLHF